MKQKEFEKIFACPKCKTPIKQLKNNYSCKKCSFPIKNHNGIWDLLYLKDNDTSQSRDDYENIHRKKFYGPGDGSYDILAMFSRGNKTIDIACGEGTIEQMAPETVGVEFSLNALKKAKAKGAKFLVLADAHALPFKNNAFDLAISNGNLEHFANPQLAINEMARVSKVQIQIVHKYPPIPLAPLLFSILTAFLQIKHQPIEKPIPENKLIQMTENAGLKIIYKGVWTLPFNYGRVIKFLPEIKKLPVCSFIITIKK